TWHHLALVYAGGGGAGMADEYRLYVDGVLDGQQSMATNTASNAQLVIGSTVEGEIKPVAGDIDEVRIWSVARTAAEIQATMRRPLTGTEPGLVLYYDMNVNSAGPGLVVPNRASATGASLDGRTRGVGAGTPSPQFVAGSPF